MKREPLPSSDSTRQPAVHALDQLAADVEAEPAAADALGLLGVEPVELLEDPLALAGGMPSPSSATSITHEPSPLRTRAPRDPPPSGEYLTALSTRLTSTWRSLCSSHGSRRAVDVEARARSTPAVHRRRLDHAARRSRRVALGHARAPPRPRRAVRPAGSGRRSWRAASASDSIISRNCAWSCLAQLDVVAPERPDGAVDGRERRAQLVRGGRDEVAARLLERALLGHVRSA